MKKKILLQTHYLSRHCDPIPSQMGGGGNLIIRLLQSLHSFAMTDHENPTRAFVPTKRFIVLFFLVLLPFAQNLTEAQTVPSAFVNIGYGARPMGLGGAYTAVADDVNAILWNPAGLTQLTKRQVTFMQTKQLNLIPYSFAAYGQPVPWYNLFAGAGFIYSGDDALKETSLYISGARQLFIDFLNIGASFKYRSASYGNNSDGGSERITGTANGIGLDLGVLYFLSSNVTLAGVYQDIYNSLNWNSSGQGKYTENVPSIFVLGVSYKIPQSIIISGEIDTQNKLRIGVEKNFFRYFVLRAGYNQNLETPIKQEYAFGLGLHSPVTYGNATLFDFLLDLGYHSGILADTFRVSLTLGF
ncbi:MAG TPA: hypothetical protein DHV62_05530 [Elusimicrobia bacterium]|jgi:hypothetical protein|nr:hypothetical protein [Elusimicrobiota bacterium]